MKKPSKDVLEWDKAMTYWHKHPDPDELFIEPDKDNPPPKRNQSALVKLERQLRLLEGDYEAASEHIVKLKAEVKKLKNILTREQHTKLIMGKTIGEYKLMIQKLEVELKALKVKLSSDHVLHTRKLDAVQVKRGYR